MLETDKKWLLIAALSTAFLLVLGGIIFFKDIVYYEREQLYYMFAYTAFAFGCFLFIARQKFVMVGILCLPMLALLVFSALKYDWRKTFITSQDYGQKALLLERIDRFPSYENHLIARLKKQPNWVGFINDCVTPAMAGQAVATNCLNNSVVTSEYGIDINAEVEAQYQRMKYTVQQVERGRIKNRRQYIGCIHTKRCASVPLLPQGVKAEEIDPRSEDHLLVRQLFWQIASGGELSQEVCSFNQFCKAMMDTGLITPRSIAAIAEENSK